MKRTLLSVSFAIAAVLLVATPGSAILPPVTFSSGGTNDSWTTNGAGTWTNNGPGAYNNQECSYIETSPLLGAFLLLDPTLSFDYAHSFENYYDGGAFSISVDGGATFSPLVTGLETQTSFHPLVRSCFTDAGALGDGVISGSRAPGSVTVDLSSVLPVDQVVIRVHLATDYSVTYDGWTISNVVLGGQPVL